MQKGQKGTTIASLKNFLSKTKFSNSIILKAFSFLKQFTARNLGKVNHSVYSHYWLPSNNKGRCMPHAV